MSSDIVHTLRVDLNPRGAGGEMVMLNIDVHDNGDDEDWMWLSARLDTACYGTSSSSTHISGFNVSDLEKLGKDLLNLKSNASHARALKNMDPAE